MTFTRRGLLSAGGLVMLGAGGFAGARWVIDASRGPDRAETVLRPVWDTYISEAKPDESYGRSRELRIDAEPAAMWSYLSFQVPDLTGRLIGARLRLYANAADHTGALVASVRPGLWTEAMTWASAPQIEAVVAQASRVEAGQWAQATITTTITRPGPVLLALVSASQTMANYASVDAGEDRAPQLILVTQQD